MIDHYRPFTSELAALNRVNVGNAQGDRVVAEWQGNTLYSTLFPSQQTQTQLTTAQRGMTELTQALAQPARQEQREAQHLADQQFEQARTVIRQEADRTRDALRSQNAERFGGSLNATFGQTALAEVERQRETQLQQARQEADWEAQGRLQALQDSRLQRLGALSALVSGNNEQASTLASLGGGLVMEDRQRRQNRRNALEQLRAGWELDRQTLVDQRFQTVAQQQAALYGAQVSSYNNRSRLNVGFGPLRLGF